MRLTILEHAGQPVYPPVSKDFPPPGATIGRGVHNHLVLADETRQISRLQASVRVDDDGSYLANLSSVCPVEVNGVGLTGEQSRRLQDGDQVRIGLYLLEVGEQAFGPASETLDSEPAAALSAAPCPAAAMAPLPAAAVPDDAFWDNLISDFAPTPHAGLLAPAAPLLAPLALAPASMPEAHLADAHLPDDALATLSNPSVDPLDFFAGSGDAASSSLFADNASSLPDTSTALLELAERDHVLTVPLATGALFGIASPGDAVAGLLAPGVARPAPSQAQPPAAQLAPQLATATASPPTADVATVPPDPARMIAAFLDGAGFMPNEGTLTEAHFHQAGRLLCKLVGGSMNLLTSRTIIKREVKAELTMMLDKENNPLKLLPDAQTVLKQMFGPPFAGFMPAERAVDDTFHDLQAHQMGMLAGMRAALNQLLRNFSPEVVDKQMGADVWYDRLMPKGRDGRAWVRYRALHQAAVTAVEEDFHTVFGQVFLSAYDAEVELYRAQRMQQAC